MTHPTRVTSLADPDHYGYVPDLSLIGTKWRHYKYPDHIYTLDGYSFDATRNCWMVNYSRPDVPIPFTRMICVFFGDIPPRQPGHPEPPQFSTRRFERIP